MDGSKVFGVPAFGPQRFQSHDDSGSTETALGTSRIAERLGPFGLHGGLQAHDRCHFASSNSASWSHARNPRLAVNQHRAAAALALWAAAVLCTGQTQVVSQSAQQRVTDIGNFDLPAVDSQLDLALTILHLPRLRWHKMVSLSRRKFFQTSLLGAASVVAACGTDSDPLAGPLIVALFSRKAVLRSGVLQRVPFGLVDSGDPLVSENEELPVKVLMDGNVISELTVTGRVVAHAHSPGEGESPHEHANLLRYYALRTVFPEPGVYDIEVDFGGSVASLPVQIFSPEDNDLPGVGDSFPSLVTPTNVDTMGVDPLCSRNPVCDLHRLSAADVLGTKPMAVLFATPAFCATAYCGPVLDVLLEEMDAFPNVEFIHVEIYSNPRQVNGNYNDPNIKVAPPLLELGLEFEPSLFLVNERGEIVDRIDNVYEGTELRAALDVL